MPMAINSRSVNVLGTFSALARVEGKEAEAIFVVIQLGVLKSGTRICTVTSNEKIVSDYK